MTVQTRVETIDRDIEALISDELSPKAASRHLAGLARLARDEALRVNRAALGREPAYETFVDGRAGAAEETVKVPGRIVYEFDVGLAMLREIEDLLVAASPVESGRYAKSFRMFVDGVEVLSGAEMPAVEEEVVFLNVQPYARKIERGQSDQAPDGVFQAVALVAGRKFSNVASVKFTYRSFVDGEVMSGGGASARKAAQVNRTPAIVVRLR